MHQQSYVFSQEWPEVCNELGIQEDDLLIFRRMDDVFFYLTVYRNEIEIRLTRRGESQKDDVFQISMAEYYDKVFKIKGRGKQLEDGYDTVVKMNKEFQGRQHIKTSDSIAYCRSADYVKKGIKVVQNAKHTKKMTMNASKRSGDGMDAEFFNFRHKGDYRLCLPVEIVKRAGLSDKLQPLSVQNMTGDVEVYETKTELNDGRLHYVIDGWQKFMSDNELEFGH
ncbi:putative DNA-binding pseudobarrel domain superfamily [Helianthus debilis subsp. tardiflorus]